MKHLDRRSFLTESAFLAAAASLAPPLNQLSAQEKKEGDKKGTPADRLRVAVVGVKGRGWRPHVEAFAAKNNCVITTVCDCDSDRSVIGPAMRYIEKQQAKPPKFEKDIRKVVTDKEVDIVSIATPNHWHALMAIWAMQNGKDVYVEKPVSHNVSEGRRIVETARKFNKICQTGTQSRSTKGMRDAMAFLHSGKLGKITKARGLCYKLRGSIGKVDGPQKPPESMDYDLWCGPAPLVDPRRRRIHYDWHWIWNYGNGDLGNQGIHEMDKARWGLNKNSLPAKVMSVGGRLGYVDDGETPNTQICWFDYGDTELIFEVRGLDSDSPYPGSRSPKRGKKPSNFVGNVWYGSEGYMVCPSYSGGIAYGKDGEFLAEFSGGGDHFANFVAAVRSRRVADLRADILEGHLSSALCHLGNISYRLGREVAFADRAAPFNVPSADNAMKEMTAHLARNKVETAKEKYRLGPNLTLDTKTETFVNNKEANAMLTREYRKGFEVPAKV